MARRREYGQSRIGACSRAGAVAGDGDDSKGSAACRSDAAGRACRCYMVLMGSDAAIATLKAHEAELKQLGVQHLYLFGSTARGDARDDSDVDLFFDHERGKLSLFDLMEVKERAARILGRKTDIMTRRSLHPLIRERVEATALQVF